MSTRRLNVAILFGGRSAEHEISIRSARTVVEALDPRNYTPILIGIDRRGHWFQQHDARALLEQPTSLDQVAGTAPRVGLIAGEQGAQLVRGDAAATAGIAAEIDVVFPVLHGPYGEDGTVQGLAKLAGVPCVGAGVLGSAVGMDKDVMKRLLRDAGIPIAPFVTVTKRTAGDVERLAAELGLPLYVKPANLGSSVGITRVAELTTLRAAVDHALTYDRKAIIESAVVGREMECSVLGNDEPVASVVGEVITSEGFYSYASKYLDESGTELVIPAKVTAAELAEIQDVAIRTFTTLECAGMARVDGFLTGNGSFVVNEINTIPGFTSISMYPKLFELSGVSYRELVDTLIQLAIERYREEQSLVLLPEALVTPPQTG